MPAVKNTCDIIEVVFTISVLDVEITDAISRKKKKVKSWHKRYNTF